MATLLGGSRWEEEITPLDDDWYSFKTEQERIENPLDMDYVPEKFRKGCVISVDLAKREDSDL